MTPSPSPHTGRLADAIADLLRRNDLSPQHERITDLVREHKNAFIHQLLAECGLRPFEENVFVNHLHTLDDLTMIATVIRQYAALLEKLRQKQEVIA